MILNGEGRHYLAVKELSALLREVTSKYHGELPSFEVPSFL